MRKERNSIIYFDMTSSKWAAELASIDIENNKLRYYKIEIDICLFDYCVKRYWGRIGRKYQDKSEYYLTINEAIESANKLLNIKLRRGYKIKMEY